MILNIWRFFESGKLRNYLLIGGNGGSDSFSLLNSILVNS